jgi:hypothetical protein
VNEREKERSVTVTQMKFKVKIKKYQVFSEKCFQNILYVTFYVSVLIEFMLCLSLKKDAELFIVVFKNHV